jgi:hypothetical protein
MTQTNCPPCGLTVSLRRGESGGGASCPRCLARSSGAMSVRLKRGAAPRGLGSEARIRQFLRKRGLSRIAPT